MRKESIFEKLAKDEDYKIRKEVTHNPSTPANILKEFIEDEDSEIRYYAAKNPNIGKIDTPHPKQSISPSM